ncbi:hypothetical protein BD410DRAFT_278944 [Rickenella mellea]|uniref:Uncharacterized protein n=1 Tax=Rickenella mellea TaxID=50990 RepID=A0A4Y7Q4C7_9AGAM|nr:hypothetical protein BD410DRAFT_278944 [Rickenella mellea]
MPKPIRQDNYTRSLFQASLFQANRPVAPADTGSRASSSSFSESESGASSREASLVHARPAGTNQAITRIAKQCVGCNSASLQECFETKRDNRDECWHPECYRMNKSYLRTSYMILAGGNEPAQTDKVRRETRPVHNISCIQVNVPLTDVIFFLNRQQRRIWIRRIHRTL